MILLICLDEKGKAMYKKMSKVEWINFTFGTNFPIDEYGHFDSRKCSVQQVQKYRKIEAENDEWYFNELREYNLFKKKRDIEFALEVLKQNGIVAQLMNVQNGHILATSKRGIKYSYYATTETIAGYYETNIAGIDWLIKLCKES